jgi:valyl-tRNA synthetase
VTAPEILFFWVARMVMLGLHFVSRAPFHTVYLHGTVRDTAHRKMSKSLGNGIDPLDVVALYGADALRYQLIAGMGLGADVILDPTSLDKSFAAGRNFVTKLWNIGRFLLTNVGDDTVERIQDLDSRRLTRADVWILGQRDAAIAASNAAIGPPRPTGPNRTWSAGERNAGLRVNEYAEAARGFVWNDLADWYLEHCKRRLGTDSDPADRAVARAVLVHAFDSALRLLHPIVPFVTEALWQKLPNAEPSQFLAQAAWPEASDGLRDDRRHAEYEVVRAAVSALRQIRADYSIPPAQVVDAFVDPVPNSSQVFVEEAEAIGRLTRCKVSLAPVAGQSTVATSVLPDGSTVFVPLANVIDVNKECRRLRDELQRADRQLGTVRERLANPAFTDQAKPDVVEGARRQEQELAVRAEQLRSKVASLCGA